MELEEAIKKLKKPKKVDLISLIRQFKREGIENFVVTKSDIIETVLNHITKQEKMIEYMVNWINMNEDPFEGCHENGKCEDELIPCGECIKQYFEKKAEESE